jgi:hypothetical protein
MGARVRHLKLPINRPRIAPKIAADYVAVAASHNATTSVVGSICVVN